MVIVAELAGSSAGAGGAVSRDWESKLRRVWYALGMLCVEDKTSLWFD